MFDSSIPYFVHFLKVASAIMKKAEAHCEAKKIKPEALLDFRLYPDMLPFTRQIQIMSDAAKGAGARLAGIPVPSFEDTEKTFADLQARVQKTLDFLATLTPYQFKDAASRTITLKTGGREVSFPAKDYLHGFAFANFHFHLSMAYAILRHNGVELGKGDYLGRS